MNANSVLFASSEWAWLWTALVIERTSSVVWFPLKRWAASRPAAASRWWVWGGERGSDLGLCLLCAGLLQTAPPLDGLIGLQPSWVTLGVSAVAMAGFVDAWRQLLAWPLKWAARPGVPASAPQRGLSLVPPSVPASEAPPAALSPLIQPRQGFQLSPLSLHRSEP